MSEVCILADIQPRGTDFRYTIDVMHCFINSLVDMSSGNLRALGILYFNGSTHVVLVRRSMWGKPIKRYRASRRSGRSTV